MLQAVEYLEQQISETHFFNDLVKQVQKDFQMAVDLDIEFTAQTPAELVVQVVNELHRVITSTSVSKFSNLLYRVDVAEADVKAIKSQDIEEYLERIAFLLLKREFQKVVIRNTF